MSIWKGKDGPEIKETTLWCLLIGIGFLLFPFYAGACSCVWNGPFFAVSNDAPLVIHGRIIRHHFGQSPTMDVFVLETLKGGILDSGMVVQMGDGMHCRPTLDGFPPGSEWILALNGPGSKPGKGLALSHCGEHWLRVEKGEVIGSIDGTQTQVKRMALDEFKRKFLYPRFSVTFSGRVHHRQRFSRPFSSRFEFILEPMPDGWEILIKECGRDENLARLTPPFHFVPNPRDIEGWHLSKNPSACTSRSHLAEAGPDKTRNFIFSPDVGKRIDGPKAGRAVIAEEIEDIRRFGRGRLTIEKFKLDPGRDGCPKIEWMEFSAHLEGGY
jgi:hypothetical protein